MAKPSDFPKVEKIILKDIIEDLLWIDPKDCKIKPIEVHRNNDSLATMAVNQTAKSEESFLEALLDKELFDKVGTDRKTKVPGGRDKGKIRVNYGKRVLKEYYLDAPNAKIAKICNLYISEIDMTEGQVFITIEAE